MYQNLRQRQISISCQNLGTKIIF